LRFSETLRLSPGMNERHRPGLPSNNGDMLAAFHAEVARLMSLSHEAFAELDPGVLEPIVTTIRATSSEVSPS
jgi:hypothetical protein